MQMMRIQIVIIYIKSIFLSINLTKTVKTSCVHLWIL